MTPRRLALALLRLYPHHWRERYQDEIRALLAEHDVRFRTLADLVFGAADAWLHPGLPSGTELSANRRARTSQFLACCATVLYALALLSVQQVRDPSPPWLAAVGRFPAIRLAFDAIQLAGGLAVLAGLGGFMLVTIVMIRQAGAGGRLLLRRQLWLAGLVGLGWAAVTAISYVMIDRRPGTGIRPLRAIDLFLQFGWSLDSLLSMLAVALLFWRALGQADLTASIIGVTRCTITAAMFAMATGLIAMLLETGLVLSSAPGLIGPGWLAVIALTMASATVLIGLARRHADGRPGVGAERLPG